MWGGQYWVVISLYSRIVKKKSRNGDTLGPLWAKQGNQGDWHKQDDQGKVSIIIFGMSKSSGFQKSRNGDTLGPVELILWLDQGNQGDRRMTRVRYLSSYLDWVSHQDFKNIAYVGFSRHFVCVFVVVFVIVFVFVFVSSYDF